MKKTELYRVVTTFPGADHESSFYYNTRDKAITTLSEYDNGHVEPVVIESDYDLNYSDGATLADLTYGEFDVKIFAK